MSDYISKEVTVQRFVKEIEHSRSDCIHINTIKRLLDDIDTLDEKEIIRKAFERVVERLENCVELTFDKSVRGDLNAGQRNLAYHKALKILKEECGINE